MADPTLPTLIRVAKSKPVRRELVCPECGGEIELIGGWLVCEPFSSIRKLGVSGEYFHQFKTLAELGVKGEANG